MTDQLANRSLPGQHRAAIDAARRRYYRERAGATRPQAGGHHPVPRRPRPAGKAGDYGPEGPRRPRGPRADGNQSGPGGRAGLARRDAEHAPSGSRCLLADSENRGSCVSIQSQPAGRLRRLVGVLPAAPAEAGPGSPGRGLPGQPAGSDVFPVQLGVLPGAGGPLDLAEPDRTGGGIGAERGGPGGAVVRGWKSRSFAGSPSRTAST